MVSHLIFAMTLVFGKQELRDVFQKKCMIMVKKDITHFLHSVTGLSLIAQKDISQTIVQI